MFLKKVGYFNKKYIRYYKENYNNINNNIRYYEENYLYCNIFFI